MPSTRTTNWAVTAPVDHSQLKDVPAAIRSVRVDLQDRLSDILSGFTAGESYNGIKLARLITVGTGTPTANTNTGAYLAVDLYAKTKTYHTGSSTQAEIHALDANSNEIQITKNGKLCLDNARLSNGTWLVGRNTGSTADVNLIRLTTSNTIDIGTTFAAHLSVADTGPTSQFHLTPKGYVDNVNTGHIASTNPHAAAKYANGDYSYSIEIRDGTASAAGLATIPLQNSYLAGYYDCLMQQDYNSDPNLRYVWQVKSMGETQVLAQLVDFSGADYAAAKTWRATIIGLKA
jgi:hypothetical protein